MADRLIIFDCDGVLVDTEGPGSRRLSQWLTEAGYPISYEECRRRYSGRAMASVHREVEAMGIRLGEDFVERWNAGLPELFATGLETIPHVRIAIDAVRGAGLPYCVASSARVTKMHITLGATGLLPLFEHTMFSATMVREGKPAPDLFLHAAREMGFAPETCVVVEDSVAGTKAGVAAGMTVFSYAGDPEADQPGLAAAGGILFDDMRRLPALLGLADNTM